MDGLPVVERPRRGRTAAERRQKTALQVFVSRRNVTLRAGSELVEASRRYQRRFPRVVVARFNRDGKPDLAVFDVGQYGVEDARGSAVRGSCSAVPQQRWALVPSGELTLAVSACPSSPVSTPRTQSPAMSTGTLTYGWRALAGTTSRATSCSTTSAGRCSAWTRIAWGA